MAIQDKNNSSRILIFGDSLGCPCLLRHIPSDKIVGLVAAEKRPASHEEIRALSEELNCGFLIQPSSLDQRRYTEFLKQVEELNPDLFVVYSYSMLLREDLLSIPKHGGVNIHAGQLPEYRGANPFQWQIINREEFAGVALHKLEKTIDAGDIIDSRKVPILFSDTWIDVADKIYSAAEDILATSLQKVIEGTAEAIAQDENRAVRRKRRKPEDGQFDWGMPSIHIYNLTRALVAPLPGSFVIDASGAKETFSTFLPMSEVIRRKSYQTPFKFDNGFITVSDHKSDGESVNLSLINGNNDILAEAVILKVSKSEVSVLQEDSYREVIENFCKVEFEVLHVRFEG